MKSETYLHVNRHGLKLYKVISYTFLIGIRACRISCWMLLERMWPMVGPRWCEVFVALGRELCEGLYLFALEHLRTCVHLWSRSLGDEFCWWVGVAGCILRKTKLISKVNYRSTARCSNNVGTKNSTALEVLIVPTLKITNHVFLGLPCGGPARTTNLMTITPRLLTGG